MPLFNLSGRALLKLLVFSSGFPLRCQSSNSFLILHANGRSQHTECVATRFPPRTVAFFVTWTGFERGRNKQNNLAR